MPDLTLLNPTLRTSYTAQDFRDRVRSDIAQADSVFISDTDIDRWGFEAQSIIARQAQWFQYVTTFFTSGGTRDYDLPADCISISKVQYDVWPLQALTLAELYDMDPLWRQYDPTMPRYYVIGGGSRITLFPTPPGTSGCLVIFAALPPAPAAPLDFYYAPVGSEEALVYYGCLKASLKDAGREGLKRADYFLRMWETSLARIVGQSRALGEEQVLAWGGANRRQGWIGNTDPLWRRVPTVDG